MLYSFRKVLNSAARNSGPLSDRILSGIRGKLGRILFFKTFVTVEAVLFLIGTAVSHFEQWSIATTTAIFPLEVFGNTITSIARSSKG